MKNSLRVSLWLLLAVMVVPSALFGATPGSVRIKMEQDIEKRREKVGESKAAEIDNDVEDDMEEDDIEVDDMEETD